MIARDYCPAPAPESRASAWIRCRGGIAILALVWLTACDLDFTSPALLEDEYLDDVSVVPALVRGVIGDFSHAAATLPGYGGVYTAGALLTDELVSSGLRESHRGFSDGFVNDSWDDVDDLWAEASRARWTSENLIGRLERLIADTDAVADSAELRRLEEYRVEATLWAGFSNRLLGDNFCYAVIDTGPLEPHSVFHERAEAHFTRALELASEHDLADLLPIAHAGRAQARMMLGRWDDAVADAGMVDNVVNFQQIHFGSASSGHPREHNHLVNAISSLTDGSPTFILTVWGTPFAEWGRIRGTEEGDPRVVYDFGVGDEDEPWGYDQRRPFYRLRKYTSRGSNISIAKGTEMRLIEAEGALLGGDINTAIDKINEVRGYRGVEPIFAENANEAWELLMRERGIELWLEGRRLPDMRRWSSVPGWVPFTVVREAGPGDHTTDEVRNVLDIQGPLCLPVGASERRANPNL